MATRQHFNKETLTETIHQKCDGKIDALRRAEESEYDTVVVQKKRDEWYAKQSVRVRELADMIQSGEATDSQLSGFNIPKAPTALVDQYGRNNYTRDIEDVEKSRKRFIARLEAMKADDNGDLYLTDSDLERYFGL